MFKPGFWFACQSQGFLAIQTVVFVVGVNIHSASLLSAEEKWSTHYEIRKTATGTIS
jgi:hypothetical protein